MSNVLTGLINNVNQALYKVSRERVGYEKAVARNVSAERAALNQTIRVPVAPPTGASAANTPAAEVPDTGDVTAEYIDMTISKSQHIPVRFEGEELQALESSGTVDFVQQRFAQAFRTLCNEIELDIANAGYKKASRATGTAGTTPFNTAGTISDFANVMKILDDNGCPKEDIQLVLDNAAIANIRGKQSNFFKVNEAGSAEMLRDGNLGRAFGFNIYQSGQVPLVVKGDTNGSATLTSSDYAVGARTLTLASAGTGGFNAGDMINIAGENNGIWYGLESGDADTSVGGTLVLNRPGLRVAQTTNTSAVTVPSANWRANLAFHKDAIQLITRTPAMPTRGDKATASFMVQDTASGLVFEIREYPGFHRSTFHVTIAWGVGVVNSEHIAVLFG